MCALGSKSTTARFFRSQKHFRQWLEKNHGKVSELLVGFHKRSSAKQSLTYPQALDEALCFGWIDGVRRRIDDESYSIRFTPRKPKSIWSLINVRRVNQLIKLGLMNQSGLTAFRLRDPKKTGVYSFENAERNLDPAYEKQFRLNKKAWEFFQQQPPGYKRLAFYRVMSAKRAETRLRRLNLLITNSKAHRRERTVTGQKNQARKAK